MVNLFTITADAIFTSTSTVATSTTNTSRRLCMACTVNIVNGDVTHQLMRVLVSPSIPVCKSQILVSYGCTPENRSFLPPLVHSPPPQSNPQYSLENISCLIYEQLMILIVVFLCSNLKKYYKFLVSQIISVLKTLHKLKTWLLFQSKSILVRFAHFLSARKAIARNPSELNPLQTHFKT